MASGISSLIDDNGRFLGLFDVCGQQNVVYVDAQGVPTGTETRTPVSGTFAPVQFSGDDLMHGCPVRYVRTGT